MDITDIKNQSLGLVLDSFYQCQSCSFVDKNDDRLIVGHPCSICGKPSTGGRSYFNIAVVSLINLIQEFYHAKYEISDKYQLNKLQGADNAKLAVIILFTSLREVCMDNFIRHLINAYKLPDNIREIVISDSHSYNQKRTKLFSSLIGLSWKKAINEINKEGAIDYEKVDKFIKKVADARNNFLHQGNKWAINNKLPKECINNVRPLLNLYVALHNKFVFPLIFKN